MSTNIKVAIDEIHSAFHKLNGALFNNELPEPALLVQNRGNKKNVLGWCSTKEIWVDAATMEKRYEINLVAEYLHRPLDEVMGTLIHEMVHLDNLVKGIKDVSRNGTYHNKTFKATAEDHGLIIEKAAGIGYSLTTLKEETKSLIRELGIREEAFSISRIDPKAGGEGTKKKTSSRKYVCPGCASIIRTTKELNVICGDCKETFELEE